MAKGGATVGVVGAGSLLGREILGLLESERSAVADVRLFSRTSQGTKLEWRRASQDVRPLDAAALSGPGLHLVVFCTGEARSRQWAPIAARGGRPVVDLSSAFRLDPAVRLAGSGPVSPPNGEGPSIVGVPGAMASLAGRLLAPLRDAAELREVAATLLVPASGAGAAGVRELGKQAGALLSASRRVAARRFPHRIAFNLIPEVRGLVGGEDRAEASFVAELRRLLGLSKLPILATAVRVPVFFGAAASLALRFAAPLAPSRARALLDGAPYVKLLDDPDGHVYPTAALAAGDESVLVGRIRGDGVSGLQLFAALDPVRHAAAVAVRTALDLLR